MIFLFLLVSLIVVGHGNVAVESLDELIRSSSIDQLLLLINSTDSGGLADSPGDPRSVTDSQVRLVQRLLLATGSALSTGHLRSLVGWLDVYVSSSLSEHGLLSAEGAAESTAGLVLDVTAGVLQRLEDGVGPGEARALRGVLEALSGALVSAQPPDVQPLRAVSAGVRAGSGSDDEAPLLELVVERVQLPPLAAAAAASPSSEFSDGFDVAFQFDAGQLVDAAAMRAPNAPGEQAPGPFAFFGFALLVVRAPRNLYAFAEPARLHGSAQLASLAVFGDDQWLAGDLKDRRPVALNNNRARLAGEPAAQVPYTVSMAVDRNVVVPPDVLASGGAQASCLLWRPELGRWARDGCITVELGADAVECRCVEAGDVGLELRASAPLVLPRGDDPVDPVRAREVDTSSFFDGLWLVLLLVLLLWLLLCCGGLLILARRGRRERSDNAQHDTLLPYMDHRARMAAGADAAAVPSGGWEPGADRFSSERERKDMFFPPHYSSDLSSDRMDDHSLALDNTSLQSLEADMSELERNKLHGMRRVEIEISSTEDEYSLTTPSSSLSSFSAVPNDDDLSSTVSSSSNGAKKQTKKRRR